MQKGIVLLPTYNEKDNLQILIPILRKTYPQLDILVVDDNSPDGTPSLVTNMTQKDNQIMLLLRNHKEGLGSALYSGYKYIVKRNYSFLIQMDADLSHPPFYISKILECLNPNTVVICSRYLSNQFSQKRSISKIANLLSRAMLLNKVKDPTSGYRGYPISLVRKITSKSFFFKGYLFQIEMVFFALKLGYTIKEIPFTYQERKYGSSKLKVSEELFFLMEYILKRT